MESEEYDVVTTSAAAATSTTQNATIVPTPTQNLSTAAITTESVSLTTENATPAPTTTQNLPISVVKCFTRISGKIMATATVPGAGGRSVTLQVPQRFAAPLLTGSGPLNVRFNTNHGKIIEGEILKTTLTPNVPQNSTSSASASASTIIQVPSSNQTAPIKSLQTPWIQIPSNSSNSTQMQLISPNPQISVPNQQTPTKPQIVAPNSQVLTQNPQISTQNPQISTQNPQISTQNPQVLTQNPTYSLNRKLGPTSGRICVICGPIPANTNPKRYMGLSAKLFSKREAATRVAEGVDLNGNPTVYDVVDWLGVLMSEGLEGVRSFPEAEGRSMWESPLGFIKTAAEDPRRICRECESAVKSSYVGLRLIIKRLHKKGAVHEKYLANNQRKTVKTFQEPRKTMDELQTEDNNSQIKRKDKRVRRPPVKKVIMSIVANKREAAILHSTIAQLIRVEMKAFMKNEDSCLRKYYDEDGFIPPDEMLAEEVGKKCPIVKKVVEALFLQSRGKEDWTRPMTAAFCIAANNTSARPNSMNALQKTVALACRRVGVPVTMYSFLSKLGISWSWSTNRAAFDIKHPDGQKRTATATNRSQNPTDPEIKEEPVDIDFDNSEQPSTSGSAMAPIEIVPKKQIIVEAEINPHLIQSTAPVDDNLLIVGRNLPRMRLWPYRNVATDSAGQMLKGQAVKRRRIRRKGNQNLENLQNQQPKSTATKESSKSTPKTKSTKTKNPKVTRKKVNQNLKPTPQVQNQSQLLQKSAEEVRKALFSQRLENHLKKLKGKKKVNVVAKKRKLNDS